MKRITKLFATLALTCFAGVANAQDEEWVELPVQGWVHEWQTMDEQTDAEKLPDEDGVYKVYCRSAEQADEAGNAITDNGSLATWDSQFFITFGEENALTSDDEIRLTMKVKADADANIDTQAHAAPGSYIAHGFFPQVAFTTDWNDYSAEKVVGSAAGMYTVAFNLALGDENNFYFKNIKVEKKVIKGDPYAEWVSIAGDPVKKEYPGDPETATADNNGVYEVNCPAKVSQTWDSQFWITLNQKLPAGTKARVTFDYMATSEYTVDTQCHENPGNYIHWQCIGNVAFKTEWKSFATTLEVPSECDGTEADGGYLKNFRSIAFNLAQNTDEDVIYYFRNIDVKVAPEDVGEEPDEPQPEITWVNIIENSDLEGDDARFFYTKNADGNGQPVISTIEEGIGVDGSRGIRVTSLDREVNGVDDNGNDTYDGQDWDAQFFIRLPQAVPAGTKIKVTFDYRADNDASVDTQSHNEPGQYIHWACAGSPDFTTEWKTWEYVGKVADECDGSEADGGYLKDFHTIAFNLSKNKIATNFFFDNIKVEIPEEEVTDPDFPEITTVPFTVGECGWTTFSCKDYDVDFDYDTDAYTALYEDGYVHLFITTQLPAGEGVIINMPAGAGEYTANIIDVAGDYDYDFNELRVSDGSVTGDLETIYVLANGEKGVGFYLLKAGEFVPEGKAYLKIEDAAAREFVGFAGTTGINTVATADKAENVIYNIAGQRVVKAQKGLYIKNGKKVIK